MAKKLSKANREKAELILEHAATIQTVFWDLLGDLENILNVEISGTIDLKDCNVEDLRKNAEVAS